MRPARQFTPDFFRLRRVRKNQAANFAAANETVIPAKIMIEHQVEGGGLLLQQRLPRPLPHFGFKASTAERADDAAIREEERFGAFLLRAGTFHAGNDSQRKGLACIEARPIRRKKFSCPQSSSWATLSQRAGPLLQNNVRTD